MVPQAHRDEFKALWFELFQLNYERLMQGFHDGIAAERFTTKLMSEPAETARVNDHNAFPPPAPSALETFMEALRIYGKGPRQLPSSSSSTVNVADWILVRSMLKDYSPQEIATRTGIELAAISEIVQGVADTREAAKAFLQACALPIAQRVIKDADVDQGLELLDRLDVAPKRVSEGNRMGVDVVIGMPGASAGPDPVIDVTS